MALVCDKSPEAENAATESEIQENPDLEDGEIEDDDEDEEVPPQEEEILPEIKTEVSQILPAAVPTDVNIFNSTEKTDKSKRHADKKGKSHLTEAEKCVRMLHKLEREARERRDRERRREQVSDDWAGNVEKAIASVLKKTERHSASDGEEEEEDKKRGRKRKKKERDRKKKHRKIDASPKEEIDENEMLNVRGASPENKSHKETSPFTGDAEQGYESFESEYDSEPYTHRQNRRNIDRDRKRDRNRNREQRRDRKNFRDKNNRKKEETRPQQQDANSLCMFYMQGKCHKGDDCPYSHDALPPMKLELCKFYLMDCCAKRDKCLYMHSEFPCKYYHTGLKCMAKDNCKFAHGKSLADSLKQVLLKHLETAPKEILGEFPRLSREGAQHMVNQTQHNLELQYGIKQLSTVTIDKTNIPSLFDITVPMPLELMQSQTSQNSNEISEEKPKSDIQTAPREKKVRQTRWNDDPPVTVANLLPVLNPAFVGTNVGNNSGVQSIFPQLNLQDQQKLQEYQMSFQMKGFYSEQDQDMRIHSNGDVDMRTLPQIIKQPAPQLSFEKYCEDANLTLKLTTNVDTQKSDTAANNEKSDNQNVEIIKMDVDIRNLTGSESSLHIVDETQSKSDLTSMSMSNVKNEEIDDDKLTDVPSNLPKKQRELFLRIQAQQKENPPVNDEKEDEPINNDDDWYSSDDENDPLSKMVIHLEDEENPIRIEGEDEPTNEKKIFSPPQILIKPVEVFDKLGDLSKIDISDEVTKLLQTMQGNSNVSPSTSTSSVLAPTSQPEIKKSRDPRQSKLDPEITSPKSSGSSSDPRMSKLSGSVASNSTITSPKSERRLSSSHRITIYEQGIISPEEKKSIFEHAGKVGIDTGSIGKADVDLRNLGGLGNLESLSEDLDLRQNYGDTDLRQQSGRQDVDLRQLGLPFKAMQNYTPASEIDASISSHSPIIYKVHVCDIPRPDYTGLRLSPQDAQVSSDPRLRKIFRIPSISERDSPASPKQVPTSPKPARQDPRRRNVLNETDVKVETPNLNYNQQLQLLQNSAFYQSLTSNQKVMLNQEIASKSEQSTQNDPILSGILSSLGLIPNLPNNGSAINILNNVNSMVPGLNPILGNNTPNMTPNLGPNIGGNHPGVLPNLGQNLAPNVLNQMSGNLGGNMGGIPQNIGPNLNMGNNLMNMNNQNQIGLNLGPGLLGAAPNLNMGPNMPSNEFPINFDPRNGGLLGQAPFQNFNEGQNFQYNDEFYQNNEDNCNFSGGNNFNPRERGGNFRGERNSNSRRGGGRNWNNRHNNSTRNYNNNRNMNRHRSNRSYTPP